jgi:hypothetical protein
VVGLGQGMTQEGEGDAGSTLSKVSIEGAHCNTLIFSKENNILYYIYPNKYLIVVFHADA